jgi:starvation-inducible outer membrane lipoprotein
MRRLHIAMGCLFLLSACTPSVFPYGALEGVDPNFDFSHWQLLPDQGPQRKIQLGGRILRAYTEGDTLTIITAQLPIAKNPTDRPEEGKSLGEFVILYRATVDPLFLRKGNRVIVVGQTNHPTKIEVDTVQRNVPTVTALCIHFWNASDKDILMQGSSGSDSKTLRELTYCARAF